MALNIIKMRDLYESRTKQSNGRFRFLTEMRHGLGLCDSEGNDYRDIAGNRQLRERHLRPENFSLAELAEAIVGPTWRSLFNPDSKELGRYTVARSLVEAGGDRRALTEAAGIGVDPTAFLNINTFTSVVGGLVEVKILEAFKNPAFIGDRLAPAEPTKLNGQKIIGVNRIGDRGRKRLPGEAHTRAQFNERWVLTPETRENALAVDIYKETVFFDLTGDILNVAASVGEELGYRRELEILSLIIGGTNTFNYNGTAYNTYSSSLNSIGYFNDFSNPLTDWTSLQADILKFARMQDPYTGKRLLIVPNTILVNPAKVATANLIVGATATERRTAGANTQATASTLNVSVTPSNPYSGQFEVLSSPLLEQMCVTAAADGGLALSQANADEYWWMMEAGKSFRYMQNYPLSVAQSAPNQYEMLDKGIVATYFANERGIPSVWSPWHIVRNTN